MYFSSSLDSTRHWPRPPILSATRSPRRTSALTWLMVMLSVSATSVSDKKRGTCASGIGVSVSSNGPASANDTAALWMSSDGIAALSAECRPCRTRLCGSRHGAGATRACGWVYCW
jgi:hypothetical protein